MKLILLGAPGAGKGTLASALTVKLNIPSVSTGNILREEMRNQTELGLKAKAFIESGALVPDDVVIGMLANKLAADECKNGFILDGFPRTIPQAEALVNIADIDVALSVEVPDEVIENRMTGRRTCSKCSETFHIESNPPKVADVCDKCGEALSIRKDDAPEVVKARLTTYHNETEPLKAFYDAKGKLQIMDGTKNVQETLDLALKVLGM
ncbi:MAG: adenylate kinase [Clostridia bacterium]